MKKFRHSAFGILSSFVLRHPSLRAAAMTLGRSHKRLKGSKVEWLWNILLILMVLALVALNGFFVAAEFSLVAVRRTRIQELVARGAKGAKSALKAVEHLDRSIAATQLGITIASLGLGWVAERGLANLLEEAFSGLPEPWDWLATHTVAGSIAFFVITFLHVVLGELFPKTVALQIPDRVSLWVATPLAIFALVTRPLIVLMNGAGNMVARWCGFQPQPEAMVHSVEELTLLIEDTEEAGIIDPDQAELLHNIFELPNKQVRDCMVPRNRMAAIEINTPLPRVLESVRSNGHTRLPVYEGELENIIGIVNSKDIFFLVAQDRLFVLEDAIYPALFLTPDEGIENALRLFRKAKRHMALVRDDQGHIHGLVTLEDVLEEIIGDIEDEQDLPHGKRRFLKRRRLKPRTPPAHP
jgi:CBS domain containing-hemolysin-like protein